MIINLEMSILDQIHCSLDDTFPEMEFKIALPDDIISERRNMSLSTEPSQRESEEQDFDSLISYQASQYSDSDSEQESELATSFDKSRKSSFPFEKDSIRASESNCTLQANNTKEGRKRSSRLRENLTRMNLLKQNKVTPITSADETEKMDPVLTFKPNGPIYYMVENGLLGKGGYGSVHKGYAIKGQNTIPIAFKFLEYSGVHEYYKDKDLGLVPAEVYLLKKMKNHKSVIKFMHYQKLDADQFILVTERPVHCKDLRYLQSEKRYPLTEEESRKIVKQLVKVLRKMEKKGIAHRDVKLENILYDLDKYNIKLIDFGLATTFTPGEIFNQFYGTLCNIPPEFLLNNEYDVCKESVRSVGNVLYYLLHGREPYNSRNETKTRLPHLSRSLSDEAKDLISGMFALDPEQRLTLKEVSKHPWMKSQRQRTPIRCRMSSFFRGLLRSRRGSYMVNKFPPCSNVAPSTTIRDLEFLI